MDKPLVARLRRDITCRELGFNLDTVAQSQGEWVLVEHVDEWDDQLVTVSLPSWGDGYILHAADLEMYDASGLLDLLRKAY